MQPAMRNASAVHGTSHACPRRHSWGVLGPRQGIGFHALLRGRCTSPRRRQGVQGTSAAQGPPPTTPSEMMSEAERFAQEVDQMTEGEDVLPSTRSTLEAQVASLNSQVGQISKHL